MFKRVTVLGGFAALVFGAFAPDGRACFLRRHRCACAPVYYPCPESSVAGSSSQTGSSTAAKAIEELLSKLDDMPLPIPYVPLDPEKDQGAKTADG